MQTEAANLTPEQLALRRTGITSTDIGAIVGVSPWRTSLQVALDKKGKLDPLEDNHHLERGRYFEPGMRAWYQQRTGAERVDLPGTVVSRRNRLILATPDGVPHFPGEQRALEIKVPWRASDEWGTPGTDEIPEHYLTQAHWHLIALDLERCDVAVLLFGDLVLYRVTRNERLEHTLVDAAMRFWRDHVEGDRLPMAGAADEELIRKLHPEGKPLKKITAAALPPDVQRVIPELLESYVQRKVVCERYDSLRTAVANAMGDAGELEGPGYRFHWKNDAPSAAIDWQAVAQVLLERHPAEAASLVQQHTRMRPGARKFLTKILSAQKGRKAA